MAPISFAAAKDPIAVEAYHALLENTWGENDELPEFPISDYRSILDFLDDVPSGVQVYAGRWLLNIFDELKSVGHRVSGSVRLGDRPLILMCDFERNRPDKRGWLTDLFALTTARAAEWQEQKGVGRPVLGVGVRVMTAGLEYTYIYLLANEAIGIPIDLRRNIEWRFGIANFSTFETRPLVAGRNEQCPCGINQKYKRCHGLRT